MIKKYKQVLSVLVCSLLLLSVLPLNARAQEIPQEAVSGCGDGSNIPLTAMFAAEEDDYLVYVKLGQAQQKAPVIVHEQLLSGSDCKAIGEIEATGSGWRQVGIWKSGGNDQAVSFSLSSPIISGLPDANRPSLMLISKTKPVCLPTTDCVVTVNGLQGVVVAGGTLLNEDTLHVSLPVDPAGDTITRVDYYIDSKPAYTTKQLEDFNLRYVGPGKHKLSTVITYESKQRVVIASAVDQSLTDGVGYLFYSTLYNNRTLLMIAGGIALLIVIWVLLLSIIRKIYLRHLWKVTHIVDTALSEAPDPVASQPAVAQVIQPAANEFTRSRSGIKQTIRFSVIFAVLAAISLLLVFIVNGFVLQIYHVDGPSMDTTLSSGQRLIVNKLGKTWSRVSQRTYLPKRGDIVVCLKTQSYYDLGGENFFVKRVIALAGERVVVASGVITVYNAEHPEGFNPDQDVAWSTSIQKSTGEQIDLTVGAGEVFVVGDNRPESVDSRSYGPISTSSIIGTANQ